MKAEKLNKETNKGHYVLSNKNSVQAKGKPGFNTSNTTSILIL